MSRLKRLFSAVIVFALMAATLQTASATTYDMQTDYMTMMTSSAEQGDFAAMKWYEHLRNSKINDLQIGYSTTDYKSCEEMLAYAGSSPTVSESTWATKYDNETDYMSNMVSAASQGNFAAMKWYEFLRNWKISDSGSGFSLTDYQNCDELLPKTIVNEAPAPAPSYSEDDLYWLSRVIYAEAGSDSCPDWVQRNVGWVVMNRRDNWYYPDSIEGVIFDSRFGGQFGCVNNGSIYKAPSQRAIDNAIYCLTNENELPANVMGQSNSCYGYKYYTDWEGKVYFFCIDI